VGGSSRDGHHEASYCCWFALAADLELVSASVRSIEPTEVRSEALCWMWRLPFSTSMYRSMDLRTSSFLESLARHRSRWPREADTRCQFQVRWRTGRVRHAYLLDSGRLNGIMQPLLKLPAVPLPSLLLRHLANERVKRSVRSSSLRRTDEHPRQEELTRRPALGDLAQRVWQRPNRLPLFSAAF